MFQLLIWMDNSKPSYSYNVLSLAAIISCLLAQNFIHAVHPPLPMHGFSFTQDTSTLQEVCNF